MPAVVCHSLLADKVLGEVQISEPLDLSAYRFGAQGPDVFFYHRAAPWQLGKSLRAVGSAVHRSDPGPFLGAFWEFRRARRSTVAFSYALGQLAHYALDRTAHPYIYALQARIIEEENVRYNPFFVHSRIENALDVIMLRKEAEVLPPDYNPAKSFRASDRVLDELAECLAAAVAPYASVKPTAKQCRCALEDTRTNLAALHDMTGIKRRLALKAERITGYGPFLSAVIRPVREDTRYDYANAAKTMWRSPYDPLTVRTESFFDLFERAEDDAKNLIYAFLSSDSAEEFAARTGRRGYNSGLPVTDPEKGKDAP